MSHGSWLPTIMNSTLDGGVELITFCHLHFLYYLVHHQGTLKQLNAYILSN